MLPQIRCRMTRIHQIGAALDRASRCFYITDIVVMDIHDHVTGKNLFIVNNISDGVDWPAGNTLCLQDRDPLLRPLFLQDIHKLFVL